MKCSSVENGDPLWILVRVYRHIAQYALAPNDDALELLRERLIEIFYLEPRLSRA